MFSIMTDHAIQECAQLDRQVFELLEQKTQLEQAMSGLRDLTGMETPIAGLSKQCAELDFQYAVLRQMMLGLNRTILDYMSCENRICDYSEQNTVRYARQEIGMNDFSEIAAILGEL